MKTNDWDQPEIQYSTGASNQINYITPVVQSDDIKAWPLLVKVPETSSDIGFTLGFVDI